MSSVEFYPSKVLLLESLQDQINERAPVNFQIYVNYFYLFSTSLTFPFKSPEKLIYGNVAAIEFEIESEGPFFLLVNESLPGDGIMFAIQQNNGQSACQFFGLSVFEFAEAFGRFEAERMEADQWESGGENDY
jgi:hypothetical protein